MEDAKIIELFNNNFTNVLKIEEILNNYFGEDKVDVSIPHTIKEIKNTFNFDSSITEERINQCFNNFYDNISAIIYFPTVRVTNEYDKYIDISDLYLRIMVDKNGLIEGTFKLVRSSYSREQFLCGYCHSHVPGFKSYEEAFRFKMPCLGSGPVKNTISILNTTFDEDLWSLLCLELDKYVHTESVSGVPYKSLRSVTDKFNTLKVIDFSYLSSYLYRSPMPFNSTLLDQFIKYIIESKELRFGFNGDYFIAYPDKKLKLLISNLFIRFLYYHYNTTDITSLISQYVREHNLIPLYYNKNNQLCYKTENSLEESILTYTPINVLIFKGKQITSKIDTTNIKNEEHIVGYLLSENVLYNIIQTIENLINYKYGDEDISKYTTTGKKIKFV